jgi:hypothetical protein
MRVVEVEGSNDHSALPPFELGPDGFPRPSQVVRSFRQQKERADGNAGRRLISLLSWEARGWWFDSWNDKTLDVLICGEKNRGRPGHTP